MNLSNRKKELEKEEAIWKEEKNLIERENINLINVKVPTPPTVEGSYILKCTISAEGTPSYSWEAENTTTV